MKNTVEHEEISIPDGIRLMRCPSCGNSWDAVCYAETPALQCPRCYRFCLVNNQQKESELKKYYSEAIAIKDKFLTIILFVPFFLIEILFRCMHWTTHTRLKAAIANQMSLNSRKVHYSYTGVDPIKEIHDSAERSRHKKFNKK